MTHRPQQEQMAGFIKFKSQGSESGQPEMGPEEFDLLKKARDAKNASEIQAAIDLFDSLIRLAEEAGQPAFEYQVEKALVENPGDFAKLIPIYENQLDFYKRQKNVIGEVEALLSLTAVNLHNGNLQAAQGYIHRADNRSKSLSSGEPDDPAAGDPVSNQLRVKGLKEQIRRAKTYIDSLLAT